MERKAEIARNEQFLIQLFSFYRIEKRSSIFTTYEIIVYKFFQSETVQHLLPDNGQPFPKRQILDRPKLKEFADDIFTYI